MLCDRLVFYRTKECELMAKLAECYEEEVDPFYFYSCISELLDMSISHGFYGNLWHCLIANSLVVSENAYSLSCEMTGDVGGSTSKMALNDFTIIFQLFHIDLIELGRKYNYPCDELVQFDSKNNNGYIFSKRIRDTILELVKALESATSPEEFMGKTAEFYKSFGVGELGLHKAFRIGDGGVVTPVAGIAHVKLSDLIGLEWQKKELVDNTTAFLEGRRANNCLLYGDAGTGKSTSIKAIANEYYESGLRLIEVYKHQLRDIHNVIEYIKSRKYKFVLYMDDLSFEEFETEYKYLKAVIEGGLEKKPDNVLIYATSNRRHLIRESFRDKQEADNDLHKNDTVQEKLSLSYRFGVNIYFGKPDKKEFNHIILELKQRHGIKMDDEELLSLANQWEMSHGGLSGRCASQFIDNLLGTAQ